MTFTLSRRRNTILAALAAERGASFAPVQVQKLFYLLDENVADAVGGRLFDFKPYDYGPFDAAVYHELDALQRAGYVDIGWHGPSAGNRRYSLTPAGQTAGEAALAGLSAGVRNYIGKVSAWVRSLSFAQLVGAIYKAYPAMRANSVFRG
jgi:hypothetical protein